MKVKRRIVHINEELCDGCGICVPACAEGAIQVVEGKARLMAERYCDGLGACLGECPKGALEVVEREAEEFDEEAVEEHLKTVRTPEEPAMACGCPSSQIQSFEPGRSCEQANQPHQQHSPMGSALTHWPIQIRLVPPNAPFLKGADLLVVADCSALAYPGIHRDFLEGRVVLMGCPKFDDASLYVERFKEIFEKADVKSVTVLTMEVPCCQGLPMMVRKGMELSKKSIPLEQVVISTRGEILRRARLVA